MLYLFELWTTNTRIFKKASNSNIKTIDQLAFDFLMYCNEPKIKFSNFVTWVVVICRNRRKHRIPLQAMRNVKSSQLYLFHSIFFGLNLTLTSTEHCVCVYIYFSKSEFSFLPRKSVKIHLLMFTRNRYATKLLCRPKNTWYRICVFSVRCRWEMSHCDSR